MQDWKDSFETILFNTNVLSEVCELKDKHIPTNLYKYRHFDPDDHWKDWVKGKAIANQPLNFNDPFDCTVSYDPKAYTEQWRQTCFEVLQDKRMNSKVDLNRLRFASNPVDALTTILSQHGIIIRESLLDPLKDPTVFADDLRTVLRIACFSEENDNLLMWGHYAKNHTGFCLGYDFTMDSEISKFLFPVVYSDIKPTVNTDDNTDHENVSTLRAALCKSKGWQSEQEWQYLHSFTLPERMVLPISIPMLNQSILAQKHRRPMSRLS